MLDTIILQLDMSRFKIANYEKFGTTDWEVANAPRNFRKWKNNPTAEDKGNDIKKPRLTLLKRYSRLFLKIEFSAPKMLYGDNLNELEESDFERLIRDLRDKIREMGVIVYSKDIEEAEILSFHPSKNIELYRGFTSNFVIRELKKIDLPKRFDLDEKRYRNNGEVLQFYTRLHSFVIYDKIRDLTKPDKRATDNQIKRQQSLFDFIKKERKELEILRLEVRLCKKKKMNEVLEKVGYAPNPLFKDIFKKDLCQKILNLYWDEFFSDNQFLFSTISNPQEILQLIFMKQPETKTLKAIQLFGIYALCRDEEGMRGFRQIIDSRKPKADWAVVKRSVKEFEDEIFSSSTWDFMKDIKEALANFNSYKFEKNERKEI